MAVKKTRIVLSYNNDGSFSMSSAKGETASTDEWNTITNALRLMSVSEIFRWDEGRFDESKWG